MDDVRNLLDSGENELTELHGDGVYGAGDFRSKECLELLDDADIVVTNPPFSLFREYVATLMEHGKKFVILGNKNAITYKEIFPLLRDDRLWLGYNKVKEFVAPSADHPERGNIITDGKGGLIANSATFAGTQTSTSTSAMRTCSSTAATPTTPRAIRSTTTTTPSRCPRSPTSRRTTTA